jgi:hypothetical protein
MKDKTTELTAEKYFEEKFGNQLKATDSWVVRFAEEYAEKKLALSQRKHTEPDGWILGGEFYHRERKDVDMDEVKRLGKAYYSHPAIVLTDDELEEKARLLASNGDECHRLLVGFKWMRSLLTGKEME